MINFLLFAKNFRLSLFGLLVRAQRLSGCWDSAEQLTSSRYVDRVTISDFIYFISKTGQSLSSSSSSSSSSSTLIKSHHPSSPISVLSRIYPTNIITLFLFFLLHGLPRSYFLNCLLVTPCYHLLLRYPSVFVLLSSYSHKTIARKSASSEYFCVRVYIHSVLTRRRFSHPMQPRPPP